MLARRSQEELQAVLVISDNETEDEDICAFDLSADLFQSASNLFFPFLFIIYPQMMWSRILT